jgi:hypothetical protein
LFAESVFNMHTSPGKIMNFTELYACAAARVPLAGRDLGDMA